MGGLGAGVWLLNGSPVPRAQLVSGCGAHRLREAFITHAGDRREGFVREQSMVMLPKLQVGTRGHACQCAACAARAVSA